jgi:hypothetical protein
VQSIHWKEDLRTLVPGAPGPSRQAPATRLAECQFRGNQIGSTMQWFAANMVVSETDIAPEIPGLQNLWVSLLGYWQ